MGITRHIYSIIATTAVAIMLLSCSGSGDGELDLTKLPVQEASDLNIIQTKNGNSSMRMSAPKMERYDYTIGDSTVAYEIYPEGFYVSAYTEDGELETTIVAKQAKHVTVPGNESWSAFGDVVVNNYIRGQRLETDTIYWNREAQQIYTDCYVKLSSDAGMMQGYGLTSDERARNSIIHKPFDSYSVMKDSTDVYVDTANFVGPLPKK